MPLSAEDIEAVGELVERRLEPRFERIESNFEEARTERENLEVRMDKKLGELESRTDTKLDGLFQHMEERFERVDERFEQMDRRFDQILAAIEGFAQRDEKREQEYLFLREQQTRLEKRVDKLEEQVSPV